jgi:hypothetical protein
MPKRIANNTLVLMRAGQRVTVKPGQQVDLTEAELADINRIMPRALRKIAAEVPVDEVKLPVEPKQQGGKGKQDKKDEKPAAPAGETPAAGDDL